MNVLCVVAHPDDESYWCGSTLAMHAKAGDAVLVVVSSDGVGSRFEWDSQLKEWEIAREARRLQFHAACVLLGVSYVYRQVFDDQRSDICPQLDINRAVESQVELHNPDLVYTHHVGDLNLDHRRVAEAVLVATRGGARVRCMTPEWPSRCVGPAFEPTSSEPVIYLKQKLAACKCYEAEMRAYPHPRSERAIRERSREEFMEIR